MIRGDREIDYGWFFMGDKRKENYDDWWRCEIKFHPDLDEAFGVTHTKQDIKETEYLKKLLVPHIEDIAHKLHYRVREQFIELKNTKLKFYSKAQLELTDPFLPVLPS